jgi:fluoride exporter
MLETFLVFVGGGIGAALRHGVNLAAARGFGVSFPWGTLIVNVVGSVVMGLLAGWLAFRADAGLAQHLRLFLATGILGGFTTFSAFSLDVAVLWERGAIGPAAAYAAASVVLSVAGLFGALWVVRSVA